MEIKQTLVSAVIPAYQGASTLVRAVHSVLNQTYTNVEVIVVDNGSTDGTQEIAQELMQKDQRVRLVRLEENQKPAGGRNAGVNEAKGNYIAFLDADDEWLPAKIEKQAWALEQNPEIGVVISDGRIINTITRSEELYSRVHNQYIQRMIPERMQPDLALYRLVGPVREIIYEKCIINTSSVMMRKRLFLESGGFNTLFYGPEDMDLWVRLAKRTRFAYLDSPEVRCYVSGSNVSTMSEKWLERLLSYHMTCFRSDEYADLLPLVKQNIEKYYRYLIVIRGRKRQVAQSWKTVLESFEYGFFPKLALYAALSPFGNKAYDIGLSIKALIRPSR